MRAGVVVALVALLLAACGGGGAGSRLSADAYRARIAKVRQQTARAQAQVALGLRAKTLGELRKRLDAFSAATGRIGDEVAKLNPPKNAEAVNGQLARGLEDTAKATRGASADVAKLRTPREAIAYLEQSSLNRKGAREVDEALAELRKLGYLRGS